MDIQEVSSTAGIDDLVSEQLSESPNAGNSDIESPSVAQDTQSQSQDSTPEPAAAQELLSNQAVADTTGQTPGQTPEPTPQPIRIGNRDYTPKELEAALTSAQQLGHLQNKYVEALEQLKQRPQSQPQQPQQQGQGPSPQQYIAQVRAQYDPVAKELVDKGLVEQDFATLFPGTLAQMLAINDQFKQVAGVVNHLTGEWQQSRHQAQSYGLMNQVGQQMNALAQSGEAFAPLKDPQEQQRFFQYLYNLDPKTNQVTNPEFLASQWVAYKKDQYLQNASMRQAQIQREQQTRYARADATTGTRAPGQMAQQPVNPLDMIVNDFYDRQG